MCRTPRLRRRRTGASLIELLAVAGIMLFIVVATFQLFRVGDYQATQGRNYSQIQTETRWAIRPALRVIRAAKSVVINGSMGTLASQSSTAAQLVVLVPRSSGTEVLCRYHVYQGTLYMQTSDDAAPGVAMLTGVTGIRWRYYVTSAGARTSTDGAPAAANEVTLALTVQRGNVYTSTNAGASLRVLAPD